MTPTRDDWMNFLALVYVLVFLYYILWGPGPW
jgi:hypothetical protein